MDFKKINELILNNKNEIEKEASRGRVSKFFSIKNSYIEFL